MSTQDQASAAPTVRNPKQAGTLLFDAKPQCGRCPNNCNQCFYNRDGAFFMDINQPQLPRLDELPLGAVVRVNSGHDSNVDRALAIAATAHYPHRFFNTSIPVGHFPAPYVLTVNPDEESPACTPEKLQVSDATFEGLMFVRVRVSGTNIHHVIAAVEDWTAVNVPVVLTFMRYYTDKPKVDSREIDPDAHHTILGLSVDEAYGWKKSTLNEYYCPTAEFMRRYLDSFSDNRLVTLCGLTTSGLCKDCMNCYSYYWQALKRMREASLL